MSLLKLGFLSEHTFTTDVTDSLFIISIKIGGRPKKHYRLTVLRRVCVCYR